MGVCLTEVEFSGAKQLEECSRAGKDGRFPPAATIGVCVIGFGIYIARRVSIRVVPCFAHIL